LNVEVEPAAASQQVAVVDSRLVAELTSRGVSEKQARQVLAVLTPNQPVLDQLEWGDSQVEQTPGKIRNPAGFYVSLIRDNVAGGGGDRPDPPAPRRADRDFRAASRPRAVIPRENARPDRLGRRSVGVHLLFVTFPP
jgi:hypothetical protein